MRRALAAVLLLLACGVANAQTSSIFDSASYYPTFHNIGARGYYRNDNDSDATAILLVRRQGEAAYDTAAYMVNVNWASPKFFAGSALYCGQDTTYQLKLEFTDPDGGTWARETLITTSGPPTHTVTGKQVWVSPTGSNSNDGLSSSTPKKNLIDALNLFTTGNGTNGDQLVLMPGVYYDTLSITNTFSGGRTLTRHIVGQPGAIISGADSSLLRTQWDSVTVSGTKIYRKILPATTRWPRGVWVDSLRRCYAYETMNALATDSLGVGDGFYNAPTGETLYVRLAGGESPHQRTMHVPRVQSALRIAASYWRVDSLVFRVFGVGRDNGISRGVVHTGGKQNQIRNSYFYNNARPSVYVSTLTGSPAPDRTLIERNLFRDFKVCDKHTGPSGDCWSAKKFLNVGVGNDIILTYNHLHPIIITDRGRGMVLRWNTVAGGPDGFARYTNLTLDSLSVDDSDIYQNLIMDMGADVYEPDIAYAINHRVYENTVLGGNSGAQNIQLHGPVYMHRNTFFEQRNGAIVPSGTSLDTSSVGNHQIGWFQFVNNTTYARSYQGSGLSQPQNGRFRNYRFVNNIMGRGTGICVFDYGWPQPALRNNYNFNAYDMLGAAGSNFARLEWGGGQVAFSDSTTWRTTTGYEGSGFVAYAFANIGYADTLNRVFAPAKSSRVDSKHRSVGPYVVGITSNFANHATPGFVPSSSIGAWNVDNVRPDDPGTLAIAGTGVTGVSLTFTATGTDSLLGCAKTFEVRYRTGGAVTDANWDAATSALVAPVSCAGFVQSAYAAGLTPGVTYFFGVRLTDYSGNPSAVSNSPSTTTKRKGDW